MLLRPDQRPATKHDRAVPIRSASYDATSDTVTLQPSYYRLPLRRTYELTVVTTPPGGLTDANGVYLYGSGASQPGSDIVLTFNSKALAREPWPHKRKWRRELSSGAEGARSRSATSSETMTSGWRGRFARRCYVKAIKT